ncbi:MAG: outer membrane lipid asymmetry maintenance protein MlaD [Aquimonas sp.]|nr:outer membrane lipid asymmetry maintenance protein MlaD [Aquimonas sp.]
MATSSKIEWSVGLFILMGFACAFALAFASTNAGGGLRGETYTVIARFTNAGDLKPRSPVRIAGVKIGEVTSITLDPDSFDAIATLRLSRSAGEIPADTAAAIYTSGLLGDRYIGLAPGGDPVALLQGDEILLTQSAVVLEQLIGQFVFGNTAATDGGGGDSR